MHFSVRTTRRWTDEQGRYLYGDRFGRNELRRVSRLATKVRGRVAVPPQDEGVADDAAE